MISTSYIKPIVMVPIFVDKKEYYGVTRECLTYGLKEGKIVAVIVRDWILDEIIDEHYYEFTKLTDSIDFVEMKLGNIK
jgi:hypothetical protein